MTLSRRQFIYFSAGAAFPVPTPIAWAQAFPTRPVKFVVGFLPGGIGDTTARMIAQPLQQRLGQPVIVENRPGAAGNVGTEAVVRSPSDGYTLAWAGANNVINDTLYTNLKFNFIRDIVGVASIMRGPLVMVVNPSVPAKSVSEFITYAKANPGKVNFPSSGNGSITHLAGELFKMMAGVDLVHVPYRSDAPALGDLIAGQVHVMFANLFSSIGHIRANQLRALAVTTKSRSPALPEVPTVAESLPGYEVSGWFGVGAPKGTPIEVIAILNKEINACITDPGLTARLAELGSTPMPLSPGEFGAFLVAEAEKWAKVVKFSGAKVD